MVTPSTDDRLPTYFQRSTFTHERERRKMQVAMHESSEEKEAKGGNPKQ